MQQLGLPLGIHAEHTFDSFHVSGENAMAVAAVQAVVDGRSDESQLFLAGESGAGKSHLLTAACHAASAQGLRVAYLAGAQLNEVDALLGVESCDLLCLDDVHEIALDAEEALFHAMNRCRVSRTRLLISSEADIDALTIELADLRTRLQWGPVFQIFVLQDEALYNALEQLLMARDLEWSHDVVPYMLKRFPRNVAELRRAVRTLDEASMRAKRRITIPFIKTVL